MPNLALFLLGSPRVERDGVVAEQKLRKVTALLAYLVVTGQRHDRDSLAELFNPDGDRDNTRSDIRRSLSILRDWVGAERVCADRSVVWFSAGDGVWIDVQEYRRLAAEARGKDTPQDPGQSAALLSRAALLYRGDFLHGFELPSSRAFEDWQLSVAEGLRREQAWVLERLVDYHQSREEYREAIERCQRWLSADPFDEAVHRRLMRLYALSGRRALALKQYDRCTAMLEKELGEGPDQETEELREQILRGGLGARGPRKATASVSGALPQPGPRSIPFVGRETELGRMKASAEEARAGHGRIVMLVGEAGIGKTRLLEEAAAHARTRGARVIWGRCYPDAGLPALWPWRQALGQLVLDSKPESLKRWTGARAGVLGQIIEALPAKLGPLPPPLGLDDPESERVRTAQAVEHLLVAASAEQPLTVVLDDLHCADSAALRLLEFVAHGLGDSRVLVLAACRDVESDRGDALGHALGGLARERCFERIELKPLGREQVAAMAERSATAALPPGFAEALWERTRGNALFVVESIRFRRTEMAHAAGHPEQPAGELPVPPSVRALIRQQVQGVSPGCCSLLETAAAIGAEFSVQILGRALTLSGPELLERLDEAVRARLLVEQPGSSGMYRFSHPLMQETISAELSRSRRTELHAGIAQALEEYYGDEREAHAIVLARHLALAQPLAPAGKLTRYCLLAGEQALKDKAFEEARLHFECGLSAKGPGTNDAEAAWLRYGLAQAPSPHYLFGISVEYSGSGARAFDELTAAYDFFVRTGEVASAAKVAAYPLVLQNRRTGETVGLADRALKVVPSDSIEEAILLRLHAVVDFVKTGDLPALSRRLERALGIAERLGDKVLQLRIACNRGWIATDCDSLETAAENLARARELIRAVDDPVSEFSVDFLSYLVALSSGDMSSAARHAQALLATAPRLGSDHYSKTALLIAFEMCWLRGDWAGARTASEQALAVENETPAFLQQLAIRARLELELGNREAGGRFLSRYLAGLNRRGFGHDGATGQAVHELAQLARLTGDRELLETARAAAAAIIPPGEEHLYRNWYGPTVHAPFGLAMAAALLGDRGAAGRLRQFLAPMRGWWIPSNGPTRTRLLGLLDLTLGDADAAAGELEQALGECAAQRPGPNVAWICSELAEALLARGKEGDLPRAARLLDEGLAMAKALAMVPLMERYRTLAARLPAPARPRTRRGRAAAG
jgi:DNA-binding SARP family transcriptional activator